VFPFTGTPAPPSAADTARCDAAGAGFSVETTGHFEYSSDLHDVIVGGKIFQALTSISVTFHLAGDTTAPGAPPETGGTLAGAQGSANFTWKILAPTKLHITVTPPTASPLIDNILIILSGSDVHGDFATQSANLLDDTLPRDATLAAQSDLSLSIGMILR